MNGKQLLHKGAAKVQQPHGKWSFVVGTERRPGLLHELGKERTQRHDNHRFASAGRTGFDENAIDRFACTGETLRVGEVVTAAKSAGRVALVSEQGERRMGRD